MDAEIIYERPLYADLFRELTFLLKHPGIPDDVADGAPKIFEKLPKIIRVELKLAGAPRAGNGSSMFQPTDLFIEYIAALRAKDFDKVRVIEHQIRS